jgi:hypothetical protein
VVGMFSVWKTPAEDGLRQLNPASLLSRSIFENPNSNYSLKFPLPLTRWDHIVRRGMATIETHRNTGWPAPAHPVPQGLPQGSYPTVSQGRVSGKLLQTSKGHNRTQFWHLSAQLFAARLGLGDKWLSEVECLVAGRWQHSHLGVSPAVDVEMRATFREASGMGLEPLGWGKGLCRLIEAEPGNQVYLQGQSHGGPYGWNIEFPMSFSNSTLQYTPQITENRYPNKNLYMNVIATLSAVL